MPCLQPYAKKNPNYGLQNVGYNYLKDCDSQYINIPCGYCPSCIAVKQMYMVQRIQMEALYNHIFMATLTYNNEFLPVIEVGDYSLRYADMHDLVLTIKRIRNNSLFPRDFRYLIVSEFGGLKARPHFHCLFMLPKYDNDTYNDCLHLQASMYDTLLNCWSKNVGSKSHPVYVPRCTFVRKFIRGKIRTNYDLHFVHPGFTDNGVSDCAFYVLKYMLKDSSHARRLQQALRLNYDDYDYNIIWNTVKPRAQWSKGFGLNATRVDSKNYIYDDRIINYLHECVEKTPKGSPYPFYFSPDTGLSFPLCPFYRKVPSIYSLADAHDIYYNTVDDFKLRNNDIALKQFSDFQKKVSLVQLDDFDEDLDFICI